MGGMSTVGIVLTVSVPERSLETSRRELSEDVIVRYWHPLGCRAIDLGKPPQGRVIIPSYTASRRLKSANLITAVTVAASATRTTG